MPYQEVMGKFKRGTLHSGSKKGPKVKSRQQAIAIMMSEKRKGAKYSAHGSGPFSQAEIKQGYKCIYDANDLRKMNEEHEYMGKTMARRRMPMSHME